MNRNRISKKSAVALTCAVVLGVGSSLSVYAYSASKPVENNKVYSAVDKDLLTVNEGTVDKEETVYVITNTDGSTKKIIVSEWLKNPSGKDTLADLSNLKDIFNVKGNEEFTLNGNAITWKAAGNDIYYQGTIEKQLPVDMKITYTLAGKEISPEDLEGKSGRVTIKIDYTNNVKKEVTINGKKETMYVPFAAITGTVFENDMVKNITVTNGKVINDGDKSVVVGFALPGMQANTGLSKDTLEIPENIVITADVTNFEVSTFVSMVTNEMFNKVELGDISSLDELTDSLNQLSDASKQLVDGADKLYAGIDTLYSKTGALTDGVNQLYDGSTSLKSGTSDLLAGTNQLSAGAGQLNSGLNQIDSNSDTLVGGAKQVFESLLATADTQLAAAGIDAPALTIENYSTVLNGIIANLTDANIQALANQKALEQVTAAVNANEAQIVAGVTAAVRENVRAQVVPVVEASVKAKVEAGVKAQVTEQVKAGITSQVLASAGVTEEQYAQMVAAGQVPANLQAAIDGAIAQNLDSAVAAQMASTEVQTIISNTLKAQMASDEVQAIIESNTDEQMKSAEVQGVINQNVASTKQQYIDQNLATDAVQSQIAAGVKEAQAGRTTLVSALGQINSYKEFYEGIIAYTDAVGTAKDGSTSLVSGAAQLNDGAAALNTGAGQLNDGLKSLKDNTALLVDGIKQLLDGSKELSDGMTQFNEEGIKKLVNALSETDADTLIERVNKLSELSKEYDSFGGKNSNNSGSVKFIYRS